MLCASCHSIWLLEALFTSLVAWFRAFQGVLSDGTEVAVKTLSAKSSQGKQEFLNEAGLITAVQHRSLVKLKGCCLERDHRILVYEFMENKSLHQTLFGEYLIPLHMDFGILQSGGTGT